MGFNRIVDRRIDADNPRTAGRELPAGLLSPRAAWLLTILSALVFLFAAWSLGPVPLYLSPICLLVILGYSLFKRFSWSAHLVLGLALALAPGGAWVAITGSLDERSAQIRKDLDEAARLKTEAEGLLAEFKAKHAEAMKTADEIVAHAREESGCIAGQGGTALEELL